ncbi:hypothetical protein CZ787_09970 [Halomonas citrativorans]|uniref:Uncharacterized protein n=1 Tax=Halomonas citrativorans TaxID=2742612 RepID=A0A1R4I1U8_9GAMM|nr:hypothetical protein CZ787_09970 [Halomonas citrativorans]
MVLSWPSTSQHPRLNSCEQSEQNKINQYFSNIYSNLNFTFIFINLANLY